MFSLRDSSLDALTPLLRAKGWITAGDTVLESVPAGDGNMNDTRRVRLESGGSLILKQSLPFVAKYPQVTAPIDRILSEVEFYRTVAEVPTVASRMPQLIGLHEPSHLAAFEDLGLGGDCSRIYKEPNMELSEIGTLAAWLGALHGLALEPEQARSLSNRAMRELNHAHIFVLPLQPDNGFPLDSFTPGLQADADPLTGDAKLRRMVLDLGQEFYLGDGPCLLHGDCFPGSWLRTAGGLKIIDPEFCFPGFPEFELGVVKAHLHLAGIPTSLAEAFFEIYTNERPLDHRLTRCLAGVEVIRRIIGIAQLPLEATLARKQQLLEEARTWVLEN